MMTKEKKEEIEGDSFRLTAVILCKESNFQKYVYEINKNEKCKYDRCEESAKLYICFICKIYSRTELRKNKSAQEKFKKILKDYNDWLNPIEDQYADNLNRDY